MALDQSRLNVRRRERTSDPVKLARHLQASIQEIADYAGEDVAKTVDLDRVQNMLKALHHQLSNAAAQVEEHRHAIIEAKQFGWPVEFDVIPDAEPGA